jgi:chorismate synthase
MVGIINKAIKEGNSLGGIFEVFVIGAPVGLGSHIQWDRKLDGRLARALMSIQAIKGVELGLGFEMSKRFGSDVMDEIFYKKFSVMSSEFGVKYKTKSKTKNKMQEGFYRRTNYGGGIEGGMTNGMPIILRAAMKPIPTLRKPLRSVDIVTKGPIKAAYERSDICAVPAAAVVGEAMSALTITEAFLEKFGGDSMIETRRNYDSYMEHVKKF